MKPDLRLLRVASFIVAPLGLGAALLAHETLRAIASLSLGAPSFAAHEHTALVPTACVEIALAICLLAFAVRDAMRRGIVCYSNESFVASGRLPFAFCSLAIALLAAATLFGMEYAESGSAALGLGWLGGALMPGAIVLAASIGATIWLFATIVAGRAAGLERLIALFASAFSQRSFAVRSVASPVFVHPSPLAIAHGSPCARHAGLRAPPIAPS